MNAAQHILIFAVRGYRVIVSPVLTGLFSPLGLGCRFDPTCSQYALNAVARHGALRGAALAARRLARCHPWGGHGIDPVPPAAPGLRRVHSHPPETGCASLTAAQPPELRQSH